MPNRRQAIIWTNNDDPLQRRIYASLGLNELINADLSSIRPSGTYSGDIWFKCIEFCCIWICCLHNLSHFVGASIYQHTVAKWHHMATKIWINNDSSKGFLPDGTKPSPEPVLTPHQRCSVNLTGNAQDINSSQFEKYTCKITYKFPRSQWVKLMLTYHELKSYE